MISVRKLPFIMLFAAVCACLSNARAQQQGTPPADLADASLEELMNVQVTSASKREQKISSVAAAIFVISQEDIRRSGATSIPDLLRMVPGMDVTQTASGHWGVSARGFNDIWADKLLVLIDGRSIYNPAVSGAIWDIQDVPLIDIDRIEVIRGPGATVWGANAVNGVINIITKSSRDTSGGLLQVSAGSQPHEQSLAQFGGGIGDVGHYRLFANSTLDRSDVSNVLGQPAQDPSLLNHFGFRSDWTLSQRDAVLVEGDLSSSRAAFTHENITYSPPYSELVYDASTSHIGNILGRWTRTFSSSSDIALQGYFDRVDYTIYGVHQFMKTGDLDFQHHLVAGRHDIVWGLDARVQPQVIAGGTFVKFNLPVPTSWLAAAFVQDEIRLGNSFRLTAGTKFEYNNYTAANLQPSIRASWSPDKHQSIWTAVSRALREPDTFDVDTSFIPLASPLPNGLAAVATVSGSPHAGAEELLAYEAGYRFEPNKKLSLDVSTFFNHYSNLQGVELSGEPFPATDGMPLHIVVPLVIGNPISGHTYGAEVANVINISRRWKLSPGYAWLRSQLQANAPLSAEPYFLQGDGPQHQAQLRSYLTLGSNLELDVSAYYVGSLARQSVPQYTRLDARIGWRFSDHLDVSAVGQNLAEKQHSEFGLNTAPFSVPVNIGRSAFLRATWHF